MTTNAIVRAVMDSKLSQLRSQRNTINKHYLPLFQTLETKSDPQERVKLLLEGIKNIPFGNKPKATLKNIKFILKNSSSKLSGRYYKTLEDQLVKLIKNTQARSDLSYLYGMVLDEWRITREQLAKSQGNTQEGTSKEEGGKIQQQGLSKEETKEELKRIIFGSANVNIPELESYLKEIFQFDTKKKESHWLALKEEFKKATKDILEKPVAINDVKTAISAVLNANLLSDEQATSLKEVKSNGEVLEEFTTLLTNKVKSIENWTWPAEGVMMQMQRSITGKFRSYPEEDVVDAVLLDYIGRELSTALFTFFSKILDSRSMPKKDLWNQPKREKKIVTNNNSNGNPTEYYRNNLHKENFFMTSINPATNQNNFYDGEGNGQTDGASSSLWGPLNQLADLEQPNSKQYILRLPVIESKLSLAVQPGKDFYVVQSDFEWFGPSVPHESIIAVLKFFDIHPSLLKFVTTFLAMPTKFEVDEVPTVRTRGVPINHSLSLAITEAVLFVMDFNTHKVFDITLYRLYDDFFFWGKDINAVEKSWMEINKFCRITGLKLNQDKSGSVVIKSSKNLLKENNDVLFGSDILPQNPIVRDLLQLSSSGKYTPHQASIDLYSLEFKAKLESTTTVIDWIRVYNRYMGFFLRGLGEPCEAFGMSHIDQTIRTLESIHEKVFEKTKGEIFSIISDKINKFAANISFPEAWLYLPLKSGGLALNNPYINMYSQSRHFKKLVDKLQVQLDQDTRIWNEAKEFVEKYRRSDGSFKVTEKERIPSEFDYLIKDKLNTPFPTLEEFLESRNEWGTIYTNLFNSVPMVRPSYDANAFPPENLFNSMTPYWCWIGATFGHQLIDEFGTWEYMTRDLVPLTVVTAILSEKMEFSDS